MLEKHSYRKAFMHCMFFCTTEAASIHQTTEEHKKQTTNSS